MVSDHRHCMYDPVLVGWLVGEGVGRFVDWLLRCLVGGQWVIGWSFDGWLVG